LGIFALILLILYLLWARASMVVFAISYSGELPSYEDFLYQAIMSDNIEFLIFFFAVGSIFALLAFAFSLVSIPMMLDQGTDTITAALVSATALVRNPSAMIIWSGMIALLSLFGLATLFLGIILTGPLLGHATWHAYRDLIKPPEAPDSA
jgi:uncharacterized membrane protein